MIDALSSMNTCQVLLLILALLQALTSSATLSNRSCVSSSCGDILNISYPYRLKSDPQRCGDSRFELACESNNIVLYLGDGRYYVQSIDYSVSQIRLVDDGIHKGDYSSFPRHSLLLSNLENGCYWYLNNNYDEPDSPYPPIVVIVNCSKPVSSSFYIATRPSRTMGLYSYNTSSSWDLYALVNPKALDVRDFCTICSWTMLSNYSKINSSSHNYELIHNIMADGFFLNFGPPPESLSFCILGIYSIYMGQVCESGAFGSSAAFFCVFDFHSIFKGQVCGYKYYDGGKSNEILPHFRMIVDELSYDSGHSFTCYFLYKTGTCLLDDITVWTIVDFISLLVKFIIGMPFVVILLIYTYRRRHLAMDKNIKEFLLAHNNFLPIRYSYSNIKKIIANFKHKLGEGGYGFVYKGMLRSGNEVAIKILKQSKAHGQDFINEVATIGRIHHVNVVQLIGFCFEGSKQALVYDLMSNGSLNKQIFTEDGDKFLDYMKIYEIALGVARGIEYLHRRCDMQILHFDIKPHNILLDKNFTPKVSDFGLAKLYPTNHCIVSLTVARGTLGYMAPELFYRNISGVSYKADVYSFGMLLMEMASRRKNINANAEHSSQIYFPLWVYNQVNEEKSVETEILSEERKVIEKMIIVALWYIQLNPDRRPSMSKVLEMLEGDIDELQMPPKPLIYPPDVPVNNDEAEMELETYSTSSITPIIYASFPLGDTDDV